MCKKLDIHQDEQESLDEKLIVLFNQFCELNLLEADMSKEELKINFIETIQARINEIDERFLFNNHINLLMEVKK
jgi:hypothetical protein